MADVVEIRLRCLEAAVRSLGPHSTTIVPAHIHASNVVKAAIQFEQYVSSASQRATQWSDE